MQTIPKAITVHNRDTVTLSTTSDYVRLFSIPCRTACSFNLSAQINSRDFSVSGTMTAGWNEAGLTATMTAVGKGTEGVYAIRALQTSDGADVALWIVFNQNVSGVMTLDMTVTPANVSGDVTFHDLIRSGSETGSQKGVLEFWTGNDYTVFGTSGTTI